MNTISGTLSNLPKEMKLAVAFFCITLSVGFYTGISYVDTTTASNPKGIEENYLGNEADEEADVMKFKKSKKEIMSLIHSHVLTMSLIFISLAILIYLTSIPMRLKLFLMLEPFVSILATFGGIYFLWKGFLVWKYIVMFSGILMTITFTTSVLIVLYQLVKFKKIKSSVTLIE